MSITDQVREILALRGDIGQAAIARQIGCSASAVSSALHRIRHAEQRRMYELNRSREQRVAEPNRAYAKAYQHAKRSGLTSAQARAAGRQAAAKVRLLASN